MIVTLAQIQTYFEVNKPAEGKQNKQQKTKTKTKRNLKTGT